MPEDFPNPTPNSEPNEAAAATTETALTELQAQLAAMQAKYMTALADLDNLRKRHARERDELSRYAASSAFLAILPFVDNFEHCLASTKAHHPEATEALKGFEMLAPQLTQNFAPLGLTLIKPAPGDAFNPNLHESVGEGPSDTIPHHAILSLQRPGYQLHDRLLRAAIVTLSSGKAQ